MNHQKKRGYCLKLLEAPGVMAHCGSGSMAKETSTRWTEDGLVWISNIGTCLCMLALQYVLLKIHRLRKLLALESIPTVSEVWVGVVAFWIVQVALDAVGIAFSRISFNLFLQTKFAKGNHCCDAQFPRVSSVIRTFVDRIAISCILHHGLMTLLDIIIPFTRDPRRNPQRELTRVLSRASQVLTFVHNITMGSPSSTIHFPLQKLVQDSNPRSTTQTVRLKRSQTDHESEGQRTLAWNLVVDKEALDEMKETLGPPGGFGELGFSIGRDGIRFEAMGKGTSFVLDFDVVVAEEHRGFSVRRKTK